MSKPTSAPGRLNGRQKNHIDGIVLLDKAPGQSSNQALQQVKRLYRAAKAGHAGTLDPFATGLLPVCLGQATKVTTFLLHADKEYLATARFGQATDSGDNTGQVIEQGEVPDLGTADIEAVFSRFVGRIEQTPPMFSALKVAGQRLYELARQGQSVPRKPRQVEIFELRLHRWSAPDLEFSVRCSKGTYIRTLAEDIALALGSKAHLIALRRTAITPFVSDRMHTWAELEVTTDLNGLLLPVDSALLHLPVVNLSQALSDRFAHGQKIALSEIAECPDEAPALRVYSSERRFLGVAEVAPFSEQDSYCLKPKRLFPGLV